jgi:hypothetical protein
MTIFSMQRRLSLLTIVGMSAILAALSGCPSSNESTQPPESRPTKQSSLLGGRGHPTKMKAEEQTARRSATTGKEEPGEEEVAQDVERNVRKARDLGPPLVDDPASLRRLDRKDPVWFDTKHKWVVLQGEACSADCPLEFFATYFDRSYESVLTVNVKPSSVHAGLLLAGAEAGHPARFEPKFSPPTGTEIALELRWKDAKGKLQSCPAQQWVRNVKTKKAMDANWVFAGSIIVTDEATGKTSYVADRGCEMICVLSSPAAMLDLPLFGSGVIEDRNFEKFKEHIPPAGTPVTLVFKPILSTNPSAKVALTNRAPTAEGRHANAVQKAADAAEPWLMLLDRGEYAQAWETASNVLRRYDGRRDFIKIVGDKRKPFAKVVSRQLEAKRFATTLPGAAEGQYVVLEYKVVFADNKSAVETVVLALGGDKKWRVSGYQIE